MTTVNPELLAELDSSLADSLRRASNRAEHLRLTRLQGLFGQLKAELDSSLPSSPETSTATAAAE